MRFNIITRKETTQYEQNQNTFRHLTRTGNQRTAGEQNHIKRDHPVKEEYTKLTAERKTLNQRYLALKEEVKEAEKIRKNVYGILRQEQREQQTQRKQDMER